MSKSRQRPAVHRDGCDTGISVYVWVLDRLNLSIVDAHRFITLTLIVAHQL